jgi:hypothetical protein
MNVIFAAVGQWARDVVAAWDRFWFRPSQPYTLALIRILAGAMLFYTHLVWTKDLAAFFGPTSWVDNRTSILLNQGIDGRVYAWSYLWYVDSPGLLWALHLAALAVFFAFTLGLWTRATGILTAVLTLCYCHRQIGALYGLDQINAFLALYLAIGPSGEVWSLDRWLAGRKLASPLPPPAASSGTTLAIRLIQIHLCVIYLFGGIGKARGEFWWDGSAVWWAIASLEYQSLDLTWMVHHRWLIALLTHITVFWEMFYCFFVWNKLTRPICLALALGVHGGIALALGMPTFGLAMIIANLAFLEPEWVEGVADYTLAKLPAKRLAAPA